MNANGTAADLMNAVETKTSTVQGVLLSSISPSQKSRTGFRKTISAGETDNCDEK